jgi:hypothetical protein
VKLEFGFIFFKYVNKLKCIEIQELGKMALGERKIISDIALHFK